MSNIEQAIQASQIHNIIVTVNPSDNAKLTLQTLCDDYAEADDSTEYWGSDDNGDWRVHVAKTLE